MAIAFPYKSNRHTIHASKTRCDFWWIFGSPTAAADERGADDNLIGTAAQWKA